MTHVAPWGALLCLSLLAACQPDDSFTQANTLPPRIQLSDPAAGQTARFVRIALAADDTSAQSFADTLLLRIVALTPSGVEVEESLSPYSASLSGRPAVPFPEQIFRYRLSPEPTALVISPLSGERLDSRLFPQIDDRAHELGYGLKDDGVARLAGLRPQVAYLPQDRELRLLDAAGQSLSGVLAHAARAEGLPGFTFVHSREEGLKFVLTEHDLAGSATGWLRVD